MFLMFLFHFRAVPRLHNLRGAQDADDLHQQAPQDAKRKEITANDRQIKLKRRKIFFVSNG